MFKPGQKVKFTVSVMGYKEVSSRVVAKVTKKKVTLQDEDGIAFDPDTGEELDPPFRGASSYIK
tara:strand:+ start:8647 stop:8838 length:192 start_codon:yes stop_codon:yes gene_type:complete